MATKVKGIPDGASVIIPRLVCRDPAAAIDFCANTFGAVERVRSLALDRAEEEHDGPYHFLARFCAASASPVWPAALLLAGSEKTM